MEGQFFTCPFSIKSTTIFSTLQDWHLILIWKPQIKWNLFENGITYVTKLSLSCPKKKISLEIFFAVSWTKAWRDEEVLSCILGGKWEHHITVLFISISASVPVFFSLHLTTNEKAIHFQKINVPHKKVNTAHLQSFRAVEWNVIVTRCLGSLLLMDVFWATLKNGPLFMASSIYCKRSSISTIKLALLHKSCVICEPFSAIEYFCCLIKF